MTIDAAIVAVGAFLQPLMPAGTRIVRGQANGTPPPPEPSVVITEAGLNQYTTSRYKLSGANGTYKMPKVLNLQLDFYGKSAGDMIDTAVTMLRSTYACESFPDGVEPLYCADAMQAPLITGEAQYEARWTTTLSLQYNATVTVAQASFNAVGETGVIPADITTPAE